MESMEGNIWTGEKENEGLVMVYVIEVIEVKNITNVKDVLLGTVNIEARNLGEALEEFDNFSEREFPTSNIISGSITADVRKEWVFSENEITVVWEEK